MSLKALLCSELTHHVRLRSAIFLRTYATATDSAKEEILDITSVDTQPKFEQQLTEDEAGRTNRIKSRLSDEDYKRIHGIRPYEQNGPAIHHYTLRWKQRMLGRYGLEGSGVPAGVAWPTKEEIAESKEYEKVAYPLTLQEGWHKIAEEKVNAEAVLQARQDSIAIKLAKTSQWERELNAKIAKKEADMRAAKERKERMMEEIRRHFGFKVDPKDDRFQKMLQQKEKEEKKLRKEQKKKERSEKLMARLLAEEVEVSGAKEPGNLEQETPNPTAKSNATVEPNPKDLS